ncbi:ribosome maturation factor RimM [Tengunoibacter tsumagoiensis]|nr:ribosome maturation factor RimM [Tengunoibacter tsumagoiensis]
MKDTTEWATIGTIVAPFGIRGEMKVFPLSDVPDRFAALRTIYFSSDYSAHKIDAVRPYKANMLVVKLADLHDATAVEQLRNVALLIPVSEMAQLPPDSYYHHDIVGLQVITVSGRELGKIIDIMQTGSNDVYVIKGHDGKQILIPALKDVVKQIDLIRHVMYIDPMKGLLDDEPDEEIDEDEQQ